jgi:hypothetical protein
MGGRESTSFFFKPGVSITRAFLVPRIFFNLLSWLSFSLIGYTRFFYRYFVYLLWDDLETDIGCSSRVKQTVQATYKAALGTKVSTIAACLRIKLNLRPGELYR